MDVKTALSKLLPAELQQSIGNKKINELRLRRDKKLCILAEGIYRSNNYVVKQSDIDFVLTIATRASIFAVEESLAQGFVTYDAGIRIGVCGEGVYDSGKLKSVKNINSLIIRLPMEIKCLQQDIGALLNNFGNTLIISPPSAGKTTMLREMARRLSNNGERVVIIDERYELTGINNGISAMDIGENTDVIAGIDKLKAYESAIRGCNPSIIVTDEIFGDRDLDALADCVRCGVKVLASIHGDGENVLQIYPRLKTIFKKAIILSSYPKTGTVKGIVSI